MVIERHTDRGASTHVIDAGESIDVVRLKLARSGSPAVVTPWNDVQDSYGPVPGEPKIPFHVGFESKDLSAQVNGEVKGIPEATGYLGPFPGLQVKAVDGSPGRPDAPGVASRIQIAGKQVILMKVSGWRESVHGRIRVGMIPEEDVEGSVGTQGDLMRPVFTQLANGGSDQFDSVTAVISIQVTHPGQAGTLGSQTMRQEISGTNEFQTVSGFNLRGEYDLVLQLPVAVAVLQKNDAIAQQGKHRPPPGSKSHVDDGAHQGVVRNHFDLESLRCYKPAGNVRQALPPDRIQFRHQQHRLHGLRVGSCFRHGATRQARAQNQHSGSRAGQATEISLHWCSEFRGILFQIPDWNVGALGDDSKRSREHERPENGNLPLPHGRGSVRDSPKVKRSRDRQRPEN